MHPRNRHQTRYDLKALAQSFPPLLPYIHKNKFGDESIDFSNQKAVKALNQAILKHFYVVDWDLPDEFLCPPIPGRADYIHNVADLISSFKKDIRVLDIGVGANCVYPIIGASEYGWNFIGTDINPRALKHAQKIINTNKRLQNKVELRLQGNTSLIFKGIIQHLEEFDLTICNPPFHSSLEEALSGTKRKWKNLKKNQNSPSALNFGGIAQELWTDGGEKAFIKKMILESVSFKASCIWFTTLVSKEENLPDIYKTLKEVGAHEVRTLNMAQGQKKSRIVAWTFSSTRPISVTRHK